MLPPCSVCQLYVFTQTLFHYQSQFSDIVRDCEAAKGIRRHAMDAADTNVDVVDKLVCMIAPELDSMSVLELDSMLVLEQHKLEPEHKLALEPG